MIGAEGRELQRRLLQATFDIYGAREQRAGLVTSAAGIRHGIVEEGHGRGVTSVFGPVRVTRKAYRNRREPNLYPADARLVLPGDPDSLGCGPWRPSTWPPAGSGRPRRSSRPAPASPSAAPSSPGWPRTSRPGATTSTPGAPATRKKRSSRNSDVIMMQADGKGIAMRPEHRKGGGADPAHPGIKKMAEIVAVADFAPAVREPEDIAAPPARRKAHPGPKPRGTSGCRRR